jgi:hypothetical protein
MKRIVFLSILLVACIFYNVLVAQTSKATKAKPQQAEKEKPKPNNKRVPVYLGNSDLSSGIIPKQIFDSLIVQGITARDSSGNIGRVSGFDFFYKERNLYEDSVGNYYIGVDFISETFAGNQFDHVAITALHERSKKDDTTIFENITVIMPDSSRHLGKPMMFVIGK